MLKTDGYGDGSGGYGYGYGRGSGYGIGYGDSIYITALVINDDPLTTAYQAVTLQTGDLS